MAAGRVESAPKTMGPRTAAPLMKGKRSSFYGRPVRTLSIRENPRSPAATIKKALLRAKKAAAPAFDAELPTPDWPPRRYLGASTIVIWRPSMEGSDSTLAIGAVSVRTRCRTRKPIS